MKSYQCTKIIPGSIILFFKEGIPHTGKVKDVLSTGYTVCDVTFLIENMQSKKDDWFVSKTECQIFKTAEFALPVYPDIKTQRYVRQIMHNTAEDKELHNCSYTKFLKYYRKRGLFAAAEDSMDLIGIISYIPLGAGELVVLKKQFQYNPNRTSVCRIRYETVFNNNQNILYPLIFEYVTDQALLHPDRIIVPSWLDRLRRSQVGLITEAMTRYIQKLHPDIPVVVSPDINEYAIESVWMLISLNKIRTKMRIWQAENRELYYQSWEICFDETGIRPNPNHLNLLYHS